MPKRKRSRKDNRKRGVFERNVFFVKRFPSPHYGSYFHLTTEKEICNDNEKLKQYLKVGGISFLEKVRVEGQGYRESKENVRQYNSFGSYIYYNRTNKMLRALIYTRCPVPPAGSTLISRTSAVHSVVPRFDGSHASPMVIIGLKLDFATDRHRKWERFDGNEVKEQHEGIHYIYEHDYLSLLQFSDVDSRECYYKTNTGIYVPKNTTLLMISGCRHFAHLDYVQFMVWTVCQEGTFIASNLDLRYVFYDENDGVEYDSEMIFKDKKDRFDCENFEIFEKNDTKRVLFLKSQAPDRQAAAWTLRHSRTRRMYSPELQLCIPSGGRLEKAMEWEEGIAEVEKRLKKKPWTKYVEPVMSEKTAYYSEIHKKLSQLDLNKTEAYPLQDSNEDQQTIN